MFPYDINSKALGAFIALFLFRYLRTVISVFTWLNFKPAPIREKPTYTSVDVTVVVPTTFKTPGELVKCLRGISRCGPAAIFIVTSHANVVLAEHLVALHDFPRINVLGVERLNKRVQMLKALDEVKTDIVVFADDDVVWPTSEYLDYLLAIFENPKVGAGGTRQRVARRSGNIWNFLGIAYLERRVFNNIHTMSIDGSISTLSGRTAAYRADILQDPEFVYSFQNDHWRGRPLNSDDDKFLTRYVYSRGWRIGLQADPRSIWRSPKYLYGCYAIYIGSFQTPALLIDGLQFFLLNFAFESSLDRKHAFACLALWIFFTKIVKLVPHFMRHPADVRFIPVSILFSYVHGFLNVYAALTLTQTGWGSQNLQALEQARAEKEEVVPLLREAVAAAEPYSEPTPGRIMIGDDYFSVRPLMDLNA